MIKPDISEEKLKELLQKNEVTLKPNKLLNWILFIMCCVLALPVSIFRMIIPIINGQMESIFIILLSIIFSIFFIAGTIFLFISLLPRSGSLKLTSKHIEVIEPWGKKSIYDWKEARNFYMSDGSGMFRIHFYHKKNNYKLPLNLTSYSYEDINVHELVELIKRWQINVST